MDITAFSIDSGKNPRLFSRKGGRLFCSKNERREGGEIKERERKIKGTDEERFVIKGSQQSKWKKRGIVLLFDSKASRKSSLYGRVCVCTRAERDLHKRKFYTTRSLCFSPSLFVCLLKRFQQVLPHRQIACKPLPAQLRAIEKDENLHAVDLTTRYPSLPDR